MEKEDLIQVIYNHNEFLKTSVKQIKQDIEYKEDILKVNEKHNRNSYEVENEITKLKIRLDVVEDILNTFNDDMENEDVDIEEITEQCED
jgi:hypothetical protein